MQGRVIAITGSVGKTSTKDMARVAPDGPGPVHAAEASYNNHWGVPLTLARMPADTDFAIIEIGMNHPARSSRWPGARPHVAMVTTIAAAHLGLSAPSTGSPAKRARSFAALAEARHGADHPRGS